jgi:hypothetical protein
MFHQFGYEWALDPATQIIRQQILQPESELFSLPLALLKNMCFASDQATLWLVIKPIAYRMFLVILPQIRGLKKIRAVWMPLFGCYYEPPPEFKNVDLEVIPVPEYHSNLINIASFLQGHEFIYNHFNYMPTLYNYGKVTTIRLLMQLRKDEP